MSKTKIEWTNVTACRSCGAEIFWAITKTSKRMPIDAVPTRDGNVEILRNGDATPWAIVHAEPAGMFDAWAERAHTSHFATCPEADSWRK